jgi:hypothetical protein
MYIFDCFQRGGIACGEVKRGTVQFVFGTRSNFPPTFLILKLFIRFLLVGVREGLGISLSYKWKQISIFFRRIVYVYELFSTWMSHIMELKIKDYIISSLLLAHHYLRLIVDEWWSVTVGLACQVELPIAGGYAWAGVLYIMVDSCWSWLYLLLVFIWSRPPVSLSSSLLHITPYHESCHFQASVNAWAGVLFILNCRII